MYYTHCVCVCVCECAVYVCVLQGEMRMREMAALIVSLHNHAYFHSACSVRYDARPGSPG